MLPARQPDGRWVATDDPLARFLAKCRFDALTGCVEWIGGKTRGRGKTQWYGSFWYQGKRWLAHRWAAKFIHGMEIEHLEVDHYCTNTLCVHHLEPLPPAVNTALYWIRVQVGLEELQEPAGITDDGIPFYWPPPWFSEALQAVERHGLPVRSEAVGTAVEHSFDRA